MNPLALRYEIDITHQRVLVVENRGEIGSLCVGITQSYQHAACAVVHLRHGVARRGVAIGGYGTGCDRGQLVRVVIGGGQLVGGQRRGDVQK